MGKSLSAIEKSHGVTDTSILRWLRQITTALPTLTELNRYLNFHKSNKWSGILLLDGKAVKTTKGNYMELFAVDHGTDDIVGMYSCDSETTENYCKLIDQLDLSGYKIKALVSDSHHSLFSLTKQTREQKRKGSRPYPRPSIKPKEIDKPRLQKIPHQACVIHVLRDVDRKLKYRRTKDENSKELRKRVHKMLFAKTLKSFEYRFQRVMKCKVEKPEQTDVLWKVRTNKDNLSTHLRIKALKDHSKRLYIPRSSNSVERVISMFEQRLKSMRKFKSKASARNFMRLIALIFRISSFVKVKHKYKRGKSRIQLVGGPKLTLRQLLKIQKPTD